MELTHFIDRVNQLLREGREAFANADIAETLEQSRLLFVSLESNLLKLFRWALGQLSDADKAAGAKQFMDARESLGDAFQAAAERLRAAA